jgi:predicted Rossmann-fold nucleotide-binding protein
MTMESDVDSIIRKYEPPRIGVIGSSLIKYYDQNVMLSRAVGAHLRKFIKERGEKGWLFTGGVSGVGSLAYEGIAEYSRQNGLPTDRTFTLLPRLAIPSVGYTIVAQRAFGRDVVNECCGVYFSERQKAMSLVGDALIMVEGGEGTWTEADWAVRHGKPLISFPESGGSAEYYNKNQGNVHPVKNVEEMLSVLKELYP